MKFNEYPYERPDMEKVKKDFSFLLKKFDDAESADDQIEIVNNINRIRTEVDSMFQIAHIKYTIDTVDKTNIEEINFCDENEPIYQGLISDYYKCLVNSKFRSKRTSFKRFSSF